MPAATLPPPHSSDIGAMADTSTAAAKWRSPRDSSLVTFLIVRHAEKNTAMLGHDVPLTEAGAARARELRRIAGDTGVDAIYTTPTQRAMQTAQPLASALGESLTVVYDTDETVRRLKTRHWGQVVVVVGHSDTVPQIVEGLTGKRVPAFQAEFDLLYVVTLARDGRSTILRLHYGEKS
jgi:broad specificity phosphatase PhoE